ncbi:MAG: adenylate kinase [Candidatus Bathyarchaeia archaeon]
MKNRVIVVGLAGVGKSTVLDELRKIAEADGVTLNIVNYGSTMMEIAAGMFKDRDDVRQSSLEVQHELQRKAAEFIVDHHNTTTPLIVDTHLIVNTPSGYLPGIPSHVLAAIKPDLLILVEAPVDDIAARRQSDASRRRDASTLEGVHLETQLSRAMASTCSTIAGAPLAVVVNAPGAAHEAGKRLYDLIRN